MNTARVIAAIVFALVAGAIGYEIGVTQSIATQVPAAGPLVYGYPFWHVGFGFFGLLFPLLFFFLFFGLLRAAFWGGRGYGRPHWSDPRSRFEEWHREEHQGSEKTGGTST